MAYPETIEYIKKQIEKGINPDKIKKALEDTGYQPEIIGNLMEEAGITKPDKKQSGIEKILKDFVIGIILLFAVSSLIYAGFVKENNRELFSPKLSGFTVLEIEKDNYASINLDDYFDIKDNEVKWEYGGKVCINIKISDNIASLKSIFLPNCPYEEKIKFSAKYSNGETYSDILNVKIV